MPRLTALHRETCQCPSLSIHGRLAHPAQSGACQPHPADLAHILTEFCPRFLRVRCSGLYNVALIGRILLTWFPQAPEAIVRPLATVVDPYLNLFRG